MRNVGTSLYKVEKLKTQQYNKSLTIHRVDMLKVNQ